jgi:hypothetical protein
MRGCQTASNLHRSLDRLSHGKRAVSQSLAQRLAIQELGDEVGCAIVPLADVVDDEDVGVVEGTGGARLLMKAPEPGRIDRRRGCQDFDGDIATQARIARTVDLAMPPAPSAATISSSPRVLLGWHQPS